MQTVRRSRDLTTRTLLPALSFLVAVAIARSVEPQAGLSPEVKWNILAECQMVVLPQKSALPLIAAFGKESGAAGAWDKVQEMLTAREATLEADVISTGESGASLVSESTDEIRYLTESEPPQIPDHIAKANLAGFLGAWPLTGFTPTAFETRDAGVKLEVTVQVSGADDLLDISLKAEHVRLLRYHEFAAGTLPDGSSFGVQQPFFHRMTSSPAFRLHNRGCALFGVHKLPEPPGTFELFILRVIATRAD